tara:strand:- start:259 stop:561 length:303 start_codon:yes stop_codon:yes gene_type:complete
MVLSEVDDDRNQHWESFVLISLKDIQEVVVLKEAHCSVGNLEMDSTDAFDDSLEKLRDQGIDFVYFTNFQHFLQLGQKECFFDAIGERPVFQKTLKERNC